ncbi:MAG: tetratricopeptide repeat protein [Paludibacteraceae bacterium]|nr:tetratricopeptide repeat protein [Paludibacteraceae bacterium]
MMRLIGRNILGILSAALCCLVVVSCSTQKNTWATRSFHQTKVKYNILYNGNTAYEEGLKAIRDANEDDYSHILNLYPVSNHKAAEASASQMDKTIEKCRKCIKLHSIKAKPKRDPKRANDPKYKLWLKSEEFNANMDLAWIRLGEAEFHKGDFLGAVSTFNYIIRHYENDADIIAQCQLWIARAYAEMGWQYEAEDMLNRVQLDALSKKHAKLYSAVKADVLLKGHQYHAAIPFVKIAIPYEKRKIYRPRFAYVLGQLYELEGKNSEAVSAYKSVVRMAPPNEMEFNARIRIAELGGKNSLRQLRTMAKQSKYKDRLDIIYGSMGNIYLRQGDTIQALAMYRKAIEESTQGGAAKAEVLVRAGDLYFDRRSYVEAQPCYREAVTILTADNDDFARIQQRSEVLDELIVAYQQAQLQDSLQRLSTKSDAEQRAVVEKIIADLIAAEKADSLQQAQAAREAAHGDGGPRSVNTANMLGGGGAQKGDWYFYNPQLIKQGQQEWRRRWGNRTLEDNWRRQNKQVMAASPEDYNPGEEDSVGLAANDSVITRQVIETDTHKPEYYLQQIPRTPEELAASDSLWREAMVSLVFVYRDRLGDDPAALEALQQLEQRVPGHPSLLDVYYSYYLLSLRHEQLEQAAEWRDKIMRYYPSSTQAQIVSQPDYFNRLRRMAQEQDSLYAATYTYYTKGEYARVKANKQYAQSEYPLSPLMPRFLFLNAIATARTEGQEAFVTELQDMVARYPDTELGAMAKDMLAMMGQGMESRTGGAATSLADLRGQTDNTETDTVASSIQWSEDRNQPSVVLLRLKTQEEQPLNDLLYEVALFNFSQFLIRDFDLQKIPVLGTGSALRISGFQNMDEAEWWIGLLRQNADMQAILTEVEIMPVAEVNVPLVQ